MEKDTSEAEKVHEYMGGIGNIGHLWEFVDYFEKKIDQEIAPYRDWQSSAYLKCPNFAGWLRIYAELICNKAMVELNRTEKCVCRIKSYRYKPVIEKVIKIANNERKNITVDDKSFNIRIKAIKIVVELRHTLQHGGIPNIIRDLEFKDVVEDEIRKMTMPQYYLEAKKIFQDANLLISMLPRPSITMFADGRVEIKDQISKGRS